MNPIDQTTRQPPAAIAAPSAPPLPNSMAPPPAAATHIEALKRQMTRLQEENASLREQNTRLQRQLRTNDALLQIGRLAEPPPSATTTAAEALPSACRRSLQRVSTGCTSAFTNVLDYITGQCQVDPVGTCLCSGVVCGACCCLIMAP